ncbi:MAG: ABC transporter permease subunit [Lachnospiraceae bacterium]|nr:ABC transporter permease subunit [Lachnospiraceae bacterium]MDE6999203.1 ABC transporter permease subunit [Lachnospiraceae bacterium]
MKIRWNPIVKKDLQVTARSMRFSWGLFAYDAVLVLAFLLATAVIQASCDNYYSNSNIYSKLIYLFPVLAVAQVFIVALIVPIITASSISGEKERQTFDIMLTTCMSPFSIVLGKVVSAVIRILFFVAAGMPVMALSFVVGGLAWSSLFYFVLTIILLSVLSGSIGIFCSSFCRKSISAVVLSFAVYFVIYVLTFVPLILNLLWTEGESAGESMLLLLFNPGVFFEEFFMQIMTGASLFGMEGSNFSIGDVGLLTYYLSQGKTWMFLSAACILLLSLLFMIAAAWRVNPMNASGSRKK